VRPSAPAMETPRRRAITISPKRGATVVLADAAAGRPFEKPEVAAVAA
jgi:hypothetical protein